jgi:regulator of RNase E activity RraB
MAEQWDFYPLLIDDEPASMMVNLAIAERAPNPANPVFCYVRVPMQNPRDDGLSSAEEFDTLTAIEDTIVNAVRAAMVADYVGRSTCRGRRDLYFYAADVAQLEPVIAAILPDLLPYRPETGGYDDPAWSVYFDFIHPDAADLQRMANRRVRASLAHYGDNHETMRLIDHFAYFDDEPSRDRFKALVAQHGFIIANANVTPDGQFSLAFGRNDRPSDVDEVTVELAHMAANCGGRYDGWGCSVEADNSQM